MWEYMLLKDMIALTISSLVFLFTALFIMKVLNIYHVHTKVERPNPPKPHNVTEWDPIPQGSLVKVKTPEDPMFRSHWDGLTGFVTGVSEDGVWYNVMFVSKESIMTYQVFKRSDLEYIRDVN
jgi:hypothetical protein